MYDEEDQETVEVGDYVMGHKCCGFHYVVEISPLDFLTGVDDEDYVRTASLHHEDMTKACFCYPLDSVYVVGSTKYEDVGILFLTKEFVSEDAYLPHGTLLKRVDTGKYLPLMSPGRILMPEGGSLEDESIEALCVPARPKVLDLFK